jgi:phosphosulfolactate synthase (CoM biosynthesis protein A)
MKNFRIIRCVTGFQTIEQSEGIIKALTNHRNRLIIYISESGGLLFWRGWKSLELHYQLIGSTDHKFIRGVKKHARKKY